MSIYLFVGYDDVSRAVPAVGVNVDVVISVLLISTVRHILVTHVGGLGLEASRQTQKNLPPPSSIATIHDDGRLENLLASV
jgi:hypothetical protein